MSNYIRADIRRILRRVSHFILMLLTFAFFAGLLILTNNDKQVTAVSLISSACGMLDYVLLFIGLFEFIGVFSEDFKVKTMQVAIGRGLTRTQVVLCKLVEVVILLVLDMIVLVLLTMALSVYFGVSMPMFVLMDLVKTLFVKGLLAYTTYSCLTMIVMFFTNSIVLSIFTYVLVSTGVVAFVVELLGLFGFDWLSELGVRRIMLSYLIGTADAKLALGTFDVLAFVGIIIHAAAGVFVTSKLFAMRELDF